MAKQTFTTGQVLTAAQMTSLQQTAMGGGAATAKTASYVLVAADAGTTVAMNAAGATTITVNTGLFAAGDTVFIQNLGAGVSTITAGTATVNTASSLALGQYESGILYFTAASASIFFKADGAAPSGGKVVQIVSANHSTVASNSTNNYAPTGLTATITPSSASNKILIWANIAEAHKTSANAGNQIQLGLKRGSTYIKETLGLYTGSELALSVPYSTIVYEDSPATTSATTYAVDFLNYNNTAAVAVNNNMALFSTVGSSIILMEVTP